MSNKAYQVSDWIGYLSRSDVDLLTELARSLPDNPVVINIGAGVGTSGLTFMEARPDLVLYSIDVNDFNNPYGGLVNERNAFQDAGFAFDPRYHPILGKSHDVGRTWTGGPVDMVFVDDGHTPPEIEGDITNWLPHIKNGGIIAFHDYCTGHHPGMAGIVRQFIPDEFEIGRSDNTAAFRVVKSE